MARKFFASVEIGKGVRNIEGDFDAAFLAHIPDESWPVTDLERCVWELRPRCFQCQAQYVIHFNAVDHASWALQHRDNWVWVYFADEAGWDIENGTCPECLYAMMAARGRQN